MNRWIFVSAVILVILIFLFLYALEDMEQQGTSSFGLANLVGLAVVVVGVLAAGIVLRRASPP